MSHSEADDSTLLLSEPSESPPTGSARKLTCGSVVIHFDAIGCAAFHVSPTRRAQMPAVRMVSARTRELVCQQCGTLVLFIGPPGVPCDFWEGEVCPMCGIEAARGIVRGVWKVAGSGLTQLQLCEVKADLEKILAAVSSAAPWQDEEQKAKLPAARAALQVARGARGALFELLSVRTEVVSFVYEDTQTWPAEGFMVDAQNYTQRFRIWCQTRAPDRLTGSSLGFTQEFEQNMRHLVEAVPVQCCVEGVWREKGCALGCPIKMRERLENRIQEIKVLDEECRSGRPGPQNTKTTCCGSHNHPR